MNLRFWQKPIEVVNEETKKKSINTEVIKEPLDRIRASLKTWGEAVLDAENPYMPEGIKFQNLLNIYRNIELDPHVSAMTETIYNKVHQTPFQIIGKDGEKDDKKTEMFKYSWFGDFIRGILDADYWGFSLMQITGIENGNIKTLDNIERFYIRPESKGVSKNLWQDEISFDFSKSPLDKWTVFVKSPKHLGRYNIIAKRFILKREVEQFWAVYNELFTTPYYTVKTDFDNKNHRNNLINWLQARKHSGFAVVGKDDEISAISGGAGSFSSYKEFELSTNQAMSKAFLGSTMVLDDGSSRSQAEVHENNTDSFIQSKRVWIEGIINEQLIPKMQAIGLNITTDYKFRWILSQKMTVKDYSNLISQIAPYFDLDDKEVSEKIGMTVEKKEQQVVKAVNKKTANKVENVLEHLFNESSNI